MPALPALPPLLVCLAAPEDDSLLLAWEKHLFLLQRRGYFMCWSEHQLTAGANRVGEIEKWVDNADFLILLLSADFFASDECITLMERTLGRKPARKVRVLPLLVRPSSWHLSPLAALTSLPSNKQPITSWTNEDEAWLACSRELLQTLGHPTLPSLSESVLLQIDSEELWPLYANLPVLPDLPSQINTPHLFTVPYKRNALFTGREAELREIETALGQHKQVAIAQAQAISGLGGIGKTQLALEYAYRYRQKYSSVLWMVADTRETLNAAYSNLAQLLKLPEKDRLEQRQVIEAVKGWLAEHNGWLLILDNADNLAIVSGFLPFIAPGHIILTTRAHALGRLAKRIEVRKLKPEEGTRFVLWRSGFLKKHEASESTDPIVLQAARELAYELDGLPLALDQAGAYIEETECGLLDYLALFRIYRAELLRERGSLADDHPDPVATTWRLAFEHIQSAQPAATDLLRLCAFLAPDDIPEALIMKSTAKRTQLLRELASHPLKLNAVFAELQKYSLISRQPTTRTLSIHRLVQAVLRDALSEDEQRAWASHAVQVTNAVFPWPEVTNWERCRQLLPHAQICLALMEQLHLEIIEAANLLHNVGSYLDDRAEYDEAQTYVAKAVTIRRHLLGEDHLDTAHSLHNLAAVYRDQGRLAEAETSHRQALTIYRHLLGENHPDTAASLDNLAIVYYDQGILAEAETLHQQAFAIKRRLLGENHPDTAHSLYNLAMVYRDQGKLAEAETLHQQTLAIRRDFLGESHPDTARSLEGLANVYDDQGKLSEADILYQQALLIYHDLLGENHPITARCLHGLALLYQKQQRNAEALPLFKRVWTIRQAKFGSEHLGTKNAREEYERILRRMEQPDGGEAGT